MHALARRAGAAAALIWVAACGKAPSAAPPASPSVSAALVVEKKITETREFVGRLEAVERVDVRSRVGGFITSLNFKPGTAVKRGQLLFVVDPRPFRAEAARAEAALASSTAKAELARLELRRAEKLLAEKAIAAREFDERASKLRELDAEVRAARASYEAARLNLNFTEVRAPIDGRVGKAEITVGNLIDGAAILTSIVSRERIYASFDGDQESYARIGPLIHRGVPVVARIGQDSDAGFPHEGRLEFVDNALDPRSGSVRMRASFANGDDVLVPGMLVRVQLESGMAPATALLIDERAVGTDQARKFVVVIGAANTAELRPVKLGPLVDGLRVVRQGLSAGEKVVVSGLQRVRPGAPVAARLVAMAADVPGAAPAAVTARESP